VFKIDKVIDYRVLETYVEAAFSKTNSKTESERIAGLDVGSSFFESFVGSE
jgi:hypothetical protein